MGMQAPVAEGSSAVKEQPHGIGSLEEGYNCRPGASPLLARRRMPEPAREDGAVGRKLPVSGSPSEDPGTPGPIINPVNDLSDREQPGAEKQGPRAPPTAEDDLFEELQAELIGAESAPNPTGSSTPGSARDHEAGSISQRRRSGRLGRAGKALGPERTEALPLPEPLDRLNRVFAALNTIYGFMLSNQIQVSPALPFIPCALGSNC